MFDKQASFSLYPDISSEERNHESLIEGRIRGCWCPRRPPVPASAIPPATAEIKAPPLREGERFHWPCSRQLVEMPLA